MSSCDTYTTCSSIFIDFYRIISYLLLLVLVLSRVLLAELEAHQHAWPFLTPVDHKAVPGYRKVIKKPMDFSTIREKLINNQYVCVTVTVLPFKTTDVCFPPGFLCACPNFPFLICTLRLIKMKTFSNYRYSNLEAFIVDVNLVFENCERFNEDDSEIGRAGHSMRSFFDKRWTELLK